jgi:hypothetical protein
VDGDAKREETGGYEELPQGCISGSRARKRTCTIRSRFQL